MSLGITRRRALIGFSVCLGCPAAAQTPRSPPDTASGEYGVLEKSAVFEILAVSGSLKETKQNGQELVWRRVGSPAESVLRMTNLSVGLLSVRNAVTMTFSCTVTSASYTAPDALLLDVIFRSRGGAALHIAEISLGVQCTDINQTLHPPIEELPGATAGIVFANVAGVEVTGHAEANVPGLRLLRCG